MRSVLCVTAVVFLMFSNLYGQDNGYAVPVKEKVPTKSVNKIPLVSVDLNFGFFYSAVQDFDKEFVRQSLFALGANSITLFGVSAYYDINSYRTYKDAMSSPMSPNLEKANLLIQHFGLRYNTSVFFRGNTDVTFLGAGLVNWNREGNYFKKIVNPGSNSVFTHYKNVAEEYTEVGWFIDAGQTVYFRKENQGGLKFGLTSKFRYDNVKRDDEQIGGISALVGVVWGIF